jgi:hypothetical protein
MKNILLKAILVGGIVAGMLAASAASAQIGGGGVGGPQFWKLVGTTLQPVVSTWNVLLGAFFSSSTNTGFITSQAKGDLIVASSTTNWANLAVGSNGKVLTASSTAVLGVSWETPAAGGITSFNGSTSSTQTLATAGATGGFSWSTSNGVHTLTITTSSGSTTGLLTNTDWNTFNDKQSTISFPIPVASTSLVATSPLALTVNTLSLLDGSLTNAHISSTAAIAYSKLSLTASIVNADVSSTAAIADTKLDTIATAGKVSGAALTSLGSIPAGAGVIPIANMPSLTLTATSTTGEAVSSTHALFIEDTTDTVTRTSSTASSTTASMGDDAAASAKLAQSFSLTNLKRVNQVRIEIGKNGTPIDSVTVSIQTDSSGVPSGTKLASTTLASSSLTSNQSLITFSLDQIVAVSSGTTYWVVFERTGAIDASNYYLWSRCTNNCYGSGELYRLATATWTAITNSDSTFYVDFVSVAGRAYRTSASQTGEYETFIGFARDTTAAGSTVTIDVGGVIAGFSLVTGKQYYISDTFGQISTSTGTNTRKVGISISSSSLLITNNW